MGTVYDYIQLVSVNLNIIAHISQFLHYTGISLCENVFGINARFVIEVIYGSLVAAHIAFVQKIKAGYFVALAARCNRFLFRRNNHICFSA